MRPEPFKLDKLPTHVGRARQKSKFDEVLTEMDELDLNEVMGFVGNNRFDTQQIKRLAKNRLPNKWFDIFGRTEENREYQVYITLIRIEESNPKKEAI